MTHFHFVRDLEADWDLHDEDDSEWDMINKGLLVQEDPEFPDPTFYEHFVYAIKGPHSWLLRSASDLYWKLRRKYWKYFPPNEDDIPF